MTKEKLRTQLIVDEYVKAANASGAYLNDKAMDLRSELVEAFGFEPNEEIDLDTIINFQGYGYRYNFGTDKYEKVA
ncbi:hypothetical protein [Fructilactobacillus florum]|uniref:Uncharacterized protein n=1 Tax=Fructilactobacillus florum DSM 22689 = JCM 16035 TaxID=1423745 RepID=A0A0R2CPW8_9LACO|nr:hypothetical protein [Fructilactobacillus florum]KRM89811.1 hypothetical protein FC87_GL000328 [Fructilactobacillus florum DSM 22689 = JCM 16035]